MKYLYLLIVSIGASVILLSCTPAIIAQTNSTANLNVKSFGAVGDGLTNDSAAFETAIINASEKNETIYIPKGVYLISNLLLFPNVHIKGDPTGAILKLFPSAGNKRQCMIFDKFTHDISIDNITFDANRENNPGAFLYCIWTNLSNGSIKNITFNNCTFSGSNGYGALFLIGPLGGISYVSVTNCNFTNTGACAMELRGVSNMIFSNNTISNWDVVDKKNPAIALQSQDCSNLVFTRNVFQNNDAAYFAIESAGAFVRNSQFTGNLFNGNNQEATGFSGYYSHCLFKNNRQIKGGGSHRSGYELVGDFDTVSNAYIDNGTISLTSSATTPVEHGGHNYFLSYDTIINRSLNGMCIGIGGADTVQNVIITNNILDNRNSTGSAPVILIGARGLSRNILIKNNTLYGQSTSSCIRFNVVGLSSLPSGANYGSENISIVSNTFIGPKGVSVDHPEAWKNVEFDSNDFSRVSTSVFDRQLPTEFKIH